MSLKLFKNLFKNSKRNQIKKLFAQVEELKEENENLAHELTMLKSAQEGNEYTPDDIEEINSRLDDLESKNCDYDVEEIYNDVDELKSKIDNIDYDNLSYDLQDKMDRLDDLENNQSDIDEIKDKLDDLEYSDDKRQDDINEVKDRLIELENQGAPSSEELSAKIVELKQVKQDLKNIFVKIADIFND